jgi:DNA-binding response OmpR family regulator
MDTRGDILIVDDHQPIGEFMSEALQDEGYTVRIALDEANARALVEERRPDLILADLHLGRTSGIDLVHHLADIGMVEVPVILMTADNLAARALALNEGVICLIKPFDLDDLIDCVEKHVRRNRVA